VPSVSGTEQLVPGAALGAPIGTAVAWESQPPGCVVGPSSPPVKGMVPDFNTIRQDLER